MGGAQPARCGRVAGHLHVHLLGAAAPSPSAPRVRTGRTQQRGTRMTDDPITPLQADLDWVRHTLAPGDPVGPNDRQTVPMPASITETPPLGRPRRPSTSVLVTAMVAAAAVILG